MGIDLSLPSPTQIEVTLFGPGYGESILVHLGSNKWMIVDSCKEPISKKPAAIHYLISRGIDPSEAVVLVVATHWHDDHIGGLCNVVETCEKARFSCPLAFRKKEFVSAVTRFNKNNKIAGGSGVQELNSIYHTLLSEDRRPRLASVGMKIHSIPGENLEHGQPVTVNALSPSEHQVDRFLLEIARDLPEFRVTKYRVAAQKHNHCALVILLSIGELGILLGADLEENEKEPKLGWSAIMGDHDPALPRASVYKVAHHGSSNAHHEKVWTDLLTVDPYALIAPWSKSRGLPTGNDMRRIVGLTRNGYITAPPKKSASKIKRDPAVERTIQETVGKKLRRAQPPFGTLRLRTSGDNHSNWSVDLSETASSLNDLGRI